MKYEIGIASVENKLGFIAAERDHAVEAGASARRSQRMAFDVHASAETPGRSASG